MKMVNAGECEGFKVPTPYQREIKVIFAPDKNDVQEATLSQVVISPSSKTNYHAHDRSEIIYIISGEGICEYEEGRQLMLQPDVALYIAPGEKHMLINNSSEPLKMITIFVPPYSKKELNDRCSNCT